MSQTVKSLQDLDRNSFYERILTTIDQQDFAGNLVPLMPLVLTDPHFISSASNEGISHLRKVLYKIGSRSFRTTHSALLRIGMGKVGGVMYNYSMYMYIYRTLIL